MGDLFLKTLNMSIAASWLILAVVLLRFALKKAPKWIAVLLWGIVALRLAVPFSFKSALSLVPSAETFNAHNIQYETPAISSGIPAVNNAVNPILGEAFAPNPIGSVNRLYVWTFIVSVIWLVGIAAMLLYAVISYVRVRRSVGERAPYEENIFLCDQVKSPFILGLVRPKIYLPSGMDAAFMEPVIAHEKAHLARHDHWWKPLGFLILAVHWFNPLCWAAYVLLCRDIELACDEKVIRQMDLDGKKQYSAALLECNTGRRLILICWANIKSASATREQVAEAKRQFDESNRANIAYAFIYEKKAFYGLRFTNHGRRVAKNVRISFTEDFIQSLNEPNFVDSLNKVSMNECVLGVGQSIDIYFGGSEFRENANKLPIEGEIIYEDDLGKYIECFMIDFNKYPPIFTVDTELEDIRQEMRKQTHELEKLRKEVSSLRKSAEQGKENA